MPRTVVLFSGGLDSSTCLALALQEYAREDVFALSFRYGQKHESTELQQAKAILDHYGLPQANRITQGLNLARELVTSALLGQEIPAASLSPGGINPSPPAPTYVPGRNLLFVAYGNVLAETIGAESIYLGVNQIDCSNYPDCTEGFVKSLANVLAELKFGVRVEAPLVQLSKAEISRLALSLGVPVHMTHSCYRGQRPACGTCDACLLRLKGFREAGLTDPLEYVY